ncbi:putative flavoprotein involved in K+ transport [Kineosphaera limosa]|uniref:Putative oxidoreductase n=1 Tax=Kineosphaera limosa NBRC 100340 TaxID=1184609 RepID=K6WQH2_9MICO|nr:NAD(P)/FAD-dependent oxidoreductase [Kineosphaera limosa]NYE02391.1 putative flavoprotein involved in K+ transport [Kineosphaera limosa]GAB96081.1 putative oxidoreductase [Kineosphaera limosa NBRC 100340]
MTTDAHHVAREWLDRFAAAVTSGDAQQVADLFDAQECYWRDLIAMTWNLHTAEGRDAIAAMLGAVDPGSWPRDIAVTAAEVADGVTTVQFTFENDTFTGKGIARLREGGCWTFLTSAQELLEHREPRGRRRILGAEHGINVNADNWLDRRTKRLESFGLDEQPYVLIVGGGQGGISLASRLRRLGVPALVIDKHPRPGDQWRNRYHSLCLHDPVWYDHLPYLPFPDDWPVFSPKDKIGDWLESYVKIMELDYWSNTSATDAVFDEPTGTWRVTVEREGQERVLRPTHLVLATGMSGIPNMPDIPGADVFTGDLHHSSAHPGGERYRGKKAVVIGSNNSAHDICADLWENGADVTMLQRSTTHIVRSDSLMEHVLGPLYSEEAVEAGVDHDTADLIFASIPYRILPDFQRPAFDAIREQDQEFYDALEQAGFMLDFGADDSGLFLKYLRRGSGYYIDIGASDLVAKGEIKLVSPARVKELRARSVVLDDGTELEADLVVAATGYGSMNGWAAQLISQDVADAVGKCWGLGSDTPKDPGPWEGELRNMWKPTQVPNLWFMGGNLHQARHYSRYLSLQLKARLEGLDTPVYELAPSHHKE